MSGRNNVTGLVAVFLAWCAAFASAEAAWILQDNPGEDQLRGVFCVGDNDVYAVGNYGTVLHYDGTEWVLDLEFPGARNAYAVWASAADDVFVAADKGELYHNDGTGWSSDGRFPRPPQAADGCACS